MSANLRLRVVALGTLWTLAWGVSAQQPPAGNTQESPQQETVCAPSPKPSVVPKAPNPNDALENPVLDDADEEHITYMTSHIALKYNHDELDGGLHLDEIRIHWLQAFGSSQRLAAGIELPFVHFNEGMGPGTNGFGDMNVEFRAMLQKGEKFEQAAGIELTMPSASTNAPGTGQTVVRLAWGFSTPITSHTLLSGEVGYDKAVATQRSEPGDNFLEPELILTQAFGKRMAVFIDWDSYEDFNTTDYIQTLKAGLEIELDRKQKWSLAPFAQFPLTRASRAAEFKNSVGVDLVYNF